MKKLLFIAVLFSAVAPKVLSISTGFFQLSIFRILLILVPLMLIIKSLKNNGKIKISSPENKYSIIFMFTWIIYAFISVIWVEDITAWIRGMYFITVGVISVFVFQAIFTEKKDIVKSFILLGLMTLVHNLIGWYEIITGNYHFSSIETAARYSRFQVPVSVFGNVNDFSIFMLFGTFISYACYKNTKIRIVKFLFLFTMFSSIIIIIAASSRGVMVGLGIGLIWFVIKVIQNKKNQFIATSLLLFTLFSLTLFPSIRNSLLLLIGLEAQTINIGEESGRINLLKNGLYFLYRTFGFGTGSGNIEYWMYHERIYPIGELLNIHNWWAEILVGYGIVIFIMYLIFYIKLFQSMNRIYRKSTLVIDKSVSLAIMCSMVGYVVGSISSSSNIDSEWLWVFWALTISYQGLLSSKIKIVT